jgi:2-haloacid dehalogenase
MRSTANIRDIAQTVGALTFDTGGTVLDWHSGISKAFAETGAADGVTADWPALTKTWRRQSTDLVKEGIPMEGGLASLDMDGVLHQTLISTLRDHEVGGFSPGGLASLVAAWRRIGAWPDVKTALPRLRSRFVIAPFTILKTSLIIEASRLAGLSWDCVISCEMIGIYKTHPVAYETAARWLDLPHNRILMVTTHNNDLTAAHEYGFRTAFVRRPNEWGGERPPDPEPDPVADLVADDFNDLADQLGCKGVFTDSIAA